MTHRISRLIPRFALNVFIAILLGACSAESDSERILGHWRAERVQLQGISVPMGPEFVVNRNELRSIDGDITIPISSINPSGDTVTLEAPLGLGLSFRFENTNRISFDMPLVGKIYYQRVATAGPALPAPDTPIKKPAVIIPPAAPNAPVNVSTNQPSGFSSSQPIVSQPVQSPAAAQSASSVDLIREAERRLAADKLSEAETLLTQARKQYGNDPLVDYNFAILHMRHGDPDGAVRSLRDAFLHGFRAFQLLDASPDLAPLGNDPRYMALLTRYR